MSNYNNFSSLPPHEEATFLVYEQRMNDAGRSGLTMGAIAGVIVLVLATAIYLGVAPKEIDYTKDMNMSNLTKKDTKTETAPAPAPAPAPTPPPSTAPSTAPSTTPTTDPAAGSAAAAAPAAGSAAAPAEAPAPATK